jgi:hypothetical protein
MMITARDELLHLVSLMSDSECEQVLAELNGEMTAALLDSLNEKLVQCSMCNVWTTMHNAIESGWAPTYWRNGAESGDPICSQCKQQHCTFNEEFGDWELMT